MAANTNQQQSGKNFKQVLVFVTITLTILISFYLWRLYGVYQNIEKREFGWLDLLFPSDDEVSNNDHYTRLSDFVKSDLWLLYHNFLVVISFVSTFVVTNKYIILVTFLLLISVYILYMKWNRSRSEKIVYPEKMERMKNPATWEEEQYQKPRLSLATGMVYSVVAIFLVSIPWEFTRLYQTEVAKKVSIMQAGIPKECLPGEMSIIQSVRYMFTWYFSWRNDECEKYHKTIMVDPWWEIPPLLVLTSLLSRCVLHPLELLFSCAGKCLNVFFSEIPAPWQPVILIVMTIILIFSMIMIFGYRLNLPFLLRIEPKTPVYMRTQSSKVNSTDSYDGEEKVVERKKLKYPKLKKS